MFWSSFFLFLTQFLYHSSLIIKDIQQLLKLKTESCWKNSYFCLIEKSQFDIVSYLIYKCETFFYIICSTESVFICFGTRHIGRKDRVRHGTLWRGVREIPSIESEDVTTRVTEYAPISHPETHDNKTLVQTHSVLYIYICTWVTTYRFHITDTCYHTCSV